MDPQIVKVMESVAALGLPAANTVSPAEARAALERRMKLADRECLAKGVTSFQDAGSGFELIDVFKSMIDRGELRTRLWVARENAL